MRQIGQDMTLGAPTQAEDEFACAAMQARFYHHLDRGEIEAVAALVSPEGTWFRHDGPARGPDGVRLALAKRPPDVVTRHLLANVVANIDTEGALVSYELSVHARHGDAVPRLAAVLSGQDRMVRTARGWLVAEKRARPVFTFPA